MADIQYLINDPSTPALIVGRNLPAKPNFMDFKIDGFIGPTNNMYTLDHQAAMCHFSICQAINEINKFLPQPLQKWAATQTLFIQPRAGRQFNAYYDRTGLRFFFGIDPITKETIYAVNSSDVVIHETGHALLDAIRPDLYNAQMMEVWAFHEAYGDINAIINFLQHDEAIDYILNETNGNLRISNAATKLAEQMGHAIYDITQGMNGHSSASLRDAVNQFTYIEPERLPKDGRDDQLTAEPHNFSRLFTGTWYDMLVGMYEDAKQTLPPKEALKVSRDLLTSYTINAIPNAPATIRFYDSFAKAMLVQDKLNNYKYNQLMNDILIRRGIFRQAVKPMVNLTWNEIQPLINTQDTIIEKGSVNTVRMKDVMTLTLPDHMVNVEMPNDSYYEFDENGNCVETISSTATELIEHARICVEFLKEKGYIRADKNTPFEIDSEGNLVRSQFSCCFFNNGTNPTQPEYLKAYKLANNAGCNCGGTKPACCINAPKPKVLIGANTRLNVSSCGFSNTSNGAGLKLSVLGSGSSRPACS